MKNISIKIASFFVLLGMVYSACCAEMKPAENANQPIEIIMEAPGKSQGQLYSSVKSWIAETRTAELSANDADKDSGRIVLKGEAPFPCDGFMDCRLKSGTNIKFSLRIDTKDGKIRMIFSNLIKSNPSTALHAGYGDVDIVAQGDIDAAKSGAQALSNELLTYATKQSASSKTW